MNQSTCYSCQTWPEVLSHGGQPRRRIWGVCWVDHPGGSRRRALEAAQQALQRGIGDYAVRVAADTYLGGIVRVEVDWAVPNFYGSLMPLFGVSNGPFKGTAVSAFRKEGW